MGPRKTHEEHDDTIRQWFSWYRHFACELDLVPASRAALLVFRSGLAGFQVRDADWREVVARGLCRVRDRSALDGRKLFDGFVDAGARGSRRSRLKGSNACAQ